MSRSITSLSLALTLVPGAALAGWREPPPQEPQPIHVYDYSRGPIWTPNGWAQVPVEVHFPRTRPPVVVPPQNFDPPPRLEPLPSHQVRAVRPPLPSMRELGLPPLPPPPRRRSNMK